MKIIDYKDKYDGKTVICLGKFDGLHLGHQTIIKKGVELAKRFNIELFSFFIQSSEKLQSKCLFTLDETAFKAQALSVDGIIAAKANQEFFSTDKKAFLDNLVENFSPVAIVCGEDYTFGYQKGGNTSYLSEYCEENGVKCVVLPILTLNDEKISTRNVKVLLQEGNIEMANELLGGNYFVKGMVEAGRGDGSKIGFKTANLKLDEEKQLLKEGVYLTETLLDGKIYPSLTNLGNAPTFLANERKIETHLKAELGDLYGKNIVVYFKKYLRPIRKFESVDELVEQLKKDLENL